VVIAGCFVLIKLLISDVLPELIGVSVLIGDGFSAAGTVISFASIWTPIREAMSGLIRLPRLTVGGLAAEGADGSLVPIRLPIRKVLSELIRLPEIVDACFPVLELAPPKAGLFKPGVARPAFCPPR